MHQKHTLKNGVRIIIEEIPYAHSAVIGLWVRTGSRYENDCNRGVSHFIEHLLFKGTANRTAKQIAEELETLGGSLNAFTAKEYTCLYARVLAEHLPAAVDLLTDMFFHSNFAPEDIVKERKVILEEIKMYEDSPEELIHDLFATTVWQKHALGYPILGTANSVQGINEKIVLDYFQEYYTPERVVLAVAGKVQQEEVLALLEERYGDWQPGKMNERAGETPVPHAEIVFSKKDTEQVHLCLGTPGLAQGDDRMYAMMVLNNIIGGGLSSRLFQEIREQRGLVYSIYSYHASYLDTGLFIIYAGTSPGNVLEVVELSLKELHRVKTDGITRQELFKTKEQIKGSVLLSMESTSHRMSRLGRTEICFGRVITGEEIVAGIRATKPDEVQQLARDLFQKTQLTLTSIGPSDKSCNFEEVREIVQIL
ncbi:MAG TPA: insulinase family protein [Clostridia bacterium]|nr:insulinase family protein [Clostridia bacterium]